jgi:hypothetical protein
LRAANARRTLAHAPHEDRAGPIDPAPHGRLERPYHDRQAQLAPLQSEQHRAEPRRRKRNCHFRELHDLAVKGSPSVASVGISSLESPDAGREHSSVGMASAAFRRQMAEVHGAGSPWWHSNILGLFPGSEAVAFYPRAWLDACVDPRVCDDPTWLDYPPGPRVMGVDVGGGVGADRSVIAVRDGRRLLELFASPWHGVLDDARERLEPVVAELARKWGVAPDRIVYDKAGIGRSFGSYLAAHGLEGAKGYFGAGKGGRLYVSRRTANAFALNRRIDPNRDDFAPFYCGGLPE